MSVVFWKMSVSTHAYYHSMWGKESITLVEITEHSCYYPTPSNVAGCRRTRNNCATTPPPNRIWSASGADGNILLLPPPFPGESRRLLENTKKIQEIQQAQLSSSGHVRRRGESHTTRTVRDMVVEGVRPRGRPKLRYMDNIRRDVKKNALTDVNVLDRKDWRLAVSRATH